jgi:hypothetical protein
MIVEQPGAEDLVLPSGAADVYQEHLKMLGKRGRSQVPEHLIAAATLMEDHNAATASRRVVKMAREWAVLDTIVASKDSEPVIYDLHCRKTVGLTAPGEHSRLTSEVVDLEAWPYRPSDLHIPAAAQIDLRTGPEWYEDNEQPSVGQKMELFRPYDVLTSGRFSDAQEFVEGGHRWGSVVAGAAAVEAYLQAQSEYELENKDKIESMHRGLLGFANSDLLLNIAFLKRTGYEPGIDRDLQSAIHQAGISVVADMVATGSVGGYGNRSWHATDAKLLRRLPATELTFEDVPAVSLEAAKIVDVNGAGESGNTLVRHAALAGGNMGEYLEETSVSFFRHVLNVQPA